MEFFTKLGYFLSIIYTFYTSVSTIVEGSPTNNRVNNADVDCKRYPDGYKFASPTDCSEYYVCSNHVAYLLQCPITTSGRLYFNPDLKICDWPWRVDCVITTASPSTTTTKLTTTPSIANSTTSRTTISTTYEPTAPQNDTSTTTESTSSMEQSLQ